MGIDTQPLDPLGGSILDGRRLRGLRSRRAILRRAVDVASLEGLNGLSLGRLAADLGLSKSGVQALFGTKENLQIAVVEAARDAFYKAVIQPALTAPPGKTRLSALLDHWIRYASAPLFAGGCFWSANLPDFDSRRGPVSDTLVRHMRDWQMLIAAELKHAVDAAEIAPLDTDLAAFQIDAMMHATNSALRLGDATASDRLHRGVDSLLAPAR